MLKSRDASRITRSAGVRVLIVLYGDLPWMAIKAKLEGEGLNVWMAIRMGREIWQVALSFPDENRVSVQATLHGLEWRPSIWGFSGSAE